MPAFGPNAYDGLRSLTGGSGARPILPGGSATVQLDQHVELVLLHHLHDHAAQQLAKLDLLGDALPVAGRVAEVARLAPSS